LINLLTQKIKNMIFDNYNFQANSIKELIEKTVDDCFENQQLNFDVGEITVIRTINGKEIEKDLCKKAIEKINQRGQKILDDLFDEHYVQVPFGNDEFYLKAKDNDLH
jgi:hypothetical protein